MDLVSRVPTAACSLLVVSVVAAACGSGDEHRAGQGSGAAGAGGEAGSQSSEPSGGGSKLVEVGGGAGARAESTGGASGNAGASGAPLSEGGKPAGGAGGQMARAGAAGQGSTLVACGADAGLTVATGFRVDVFCDSNLLVQPNALVFGSDGQLYVANSHSLTSGVADQGEVLSVDESGVATIFATDNLMRGPDSVAFLEPATAGADPALLVGVEDQVEAGLRSTDSFLRIDGGIVTSFMDVWEPANLLRAPGGAFGSDLYYTSRTNLSGGPPNELRLFHVDEAANPSLLKVTSQADPNTEIVGATVFTWGSGGSLGQDMYLGTVADLPYSPGSVDAIYRVQASGAATPLAQVKALGLAASPSATGPYGDLLYALGTASLVAIDAQGASAPVADGLANPSGIAFGPDGVLYVADTDAKRILTVRPCEP